jgi:prepilin peptidase CpaA
MRLLQPSLTSFAAILLVVVTVVSAIGDVVKGKIFNLVTYPAIVGGIALQLAQHGTGGLTSSLQGLAVCVLPALPLFLLGGLAGGDVKLLAVVGAVAGWPTAAETLLLTCVFAGLIALGELAWHGRLFATSWRALRVAVGLVVRRWRPPAATTPPLSVRFGVAVCLGVLATLWDWQSGVLARLF